MIAAQYQRKPLLGYGAVRPFLRSRVHVCAISRQISARAPDQSAVLSGCATGTIAEIVDLITEISDTFIKARQTQGRWTHIDTAAACRPDPSERR